MHFACSGKQNAGQLAGVKLKNMEAAYLIGLDLRELLLNDNGYPPSRQIMSGAQSFLAY